MNSKHYTYRNVSLSLSELERKLRANDREYNLSFKYAVSLVECVCKCKPSIVILRGKSSAVCVWYFVHACSCVLS